MNYLLRYGCSLLESNSACVKHVYSYKLLAPLFDAIETAYQNEQAASRMLRELIETRRTPPVATIEQIEQTKRGSASFDQYQVLSWADQKNVGTANDVVVEASYLTLTEAIMYDDYLRRQGKFGMINP